MKKSDVKVELWAIADLTPYELNAKKHDSEQVAKIAESIKRFGWDQPIVVDRDGVIIKGHGRRLAALQLGIDSVPVWVRKDLSPEQVRAARLADNRVAISDIDSSLLRADLEGIDEADLDGIFDLKEIQFTKADLGEINEGAFASDMEAVLASQKTEVDGKIDKVAEGRVPLSKAFGFKDIAAAGQIAITAMMAKAEAATGLKNEEALIAWAGAL